MSVQTPRITSHKSRAEEVYNDLQREILSEKAASLGRAGKALELALDKLRNGDAAAHDDLVWAAAHAAHAYVIQREAAGLHGLGRPLDDFGVPREVRARIGARPKAAG